MDEQTRLEIYEALRQRAEADRILGATAWPVSRALLRKAAGKPPATRPLPPPPAPPAGRFDAPSPAPDAAQPVRFQRPAMVAGSPRPAARASYSVANPVACKRHPDVLTEQGKLRQHALDVLDNSQVKGCRKCGLGSVRTQTVFGQGNPEARIVFVGEAPGFEEDRSGFAFVGRAGQLLTDMIEKGMGLKREDVYICNVLKCRPPENRPPAPDEIIACSSYLFEQLRVVKPEVIVALGAPASQTLLGTSEAIGRLRGRFHDFRPHGSSKTDAPIPLMPTYHPSYLLRSPSEKVKAWEDLKKVLERLGIPIPRSAN